MFALIYLVLCDCRWIGFAEKPVSARSISEKCFIVGLVVAL